MSEAPKRKVVANYNNIEGLRTVVYDELESVPRDIWRQLQRVHHESLLAKLPRSDWSRADHLVRITDLRTYMERRVDPNKQAGQDGWNKEQIFRKPLLAVALDGSTQVVGGVLTANNTSGSKGKSDLIWKAEAWAKMLTPPGLELPKVGGRRVVHLREAYVQPGLQEALDVEDDTTVVSGLTLMGISKSLVRRSPEQWLAGYIVPADPIDSELTDLTWALDMGRTGERPNTISGFKEGTSLVRVAARVGHVIQTIVEMPGTSYSYSE